jgi:hypothetical protein
MTEVILTEEEAKSLEDALIYHMEQCYNSIYDMDEVAEGWEPWQPFDGCSNCETREYLMTTFHWLKENKDIAIYVEDK